MVLCTHSGTPSISRAIVECRAVLTIRTRCLPASGPCGENAVLAIESDVSVSNLGNTMGGGFITSDSVSPATLRSCYINSDLFRRTLLSTRYIASNGQHADI